MKKIASFIVNQSKLILIAFLLLIVYCVWGMGQVNIEYDIAKYLPQDTDTRQALSIMEEEFTTYGTAKIMIKNITFQDADALHDKIEALDGVKEFKFENTPDYYKDSCALFKITFAGNDKDASSVTAYNETLNILKDQQIFVSEKLVDNYADELQSQINFVLIVVIAIIIAVLLFTSESAAVVPVFMLTFGVAALLNMGTNYWFGTISFISNSVCAILQLALAIDYAIILYHRFAEEKVKHEGNAKEALKDALAKAIIEISSSSLTTISGLLALATMSLRLGADLGFVLAKSIICSMLTVFLFMPSMLLLFSKSIKTKHGTFNLIDKTTHKDLVPKIPFVGKFAVKFRFPLFIAFTALVIVCGVLSSQIIYVYSANSIDTPKPSDDQIAITETQNIFGCSSQFVILMPGKDYYRQKEVLDTVEKYDMIKDALGIPNTEIKMNGYNYYLTEKLTYKQFSELLAIDDSLGDTVFTAYTFLSKETMDDGIRETALYEANKNIYKVSLLELCDCAFDNDDFISAYLSGNEDAIDSYNEIRDTIQDAERQLIGKNYCRLLFEIDGEEESQETFNLIKTLLNDIKTKYPETIFAGSAMSAYDLGQSFSTDNTKVSLFSIIAVFIILVFTFKSFGLPIPLVFAIQGSIFINFSYYVFAHVNVYFFVYLIVSAIQMGATIDYAIVITNRFEEVKQTMDKKSAIIDAVNGAFPTILTSGLIMALSGFLIGALVSDPLISTLGTCLGRGVIVSILSVMIALPAMLYIWDVPISKTKFKERKRKKIEFPLIKKNKQIIKGEK